MSLALSLYVGADLVGFLQMHVEMDRDVFQRPDGEDAQDAGFRIPGSSPVSIPGRLGHKPQGTITVSSLSVQMSSAPLDSVPPVPGVSRSEAVTNNSKVPVLGPAWSS